jgi:uncharacterized protein (TIGR02597 family)
MKTKTLKLLGCALLSGLFAFVSQAQSVSSTPVGYVTLTINGDGYTALSNPLENAIVSSGTATAVSAAEITPSFTITSGELGSYTHYVQTSDGIILDIVSNTDSVITVDADVSNIVSSGDEITVKQYSTLSDLFGSDNSIGLTTSSGASGSDIIYIMSNDGAGSYSSYYYQTDSFGFFGGTGWRAVGDAFTDASSTAIGPDDGVLVKRISSGDLSLTVVGTVNTTDHRRDLPAGFSLVSYPFPATTTLAESGIYSETNGYVSAGNAASSDLVYVISPNGSFTTYYYQTDSFGFFGGTGWRVVGDAFTDASSTSIPLGSSLIIKSANGITWTDAVPYTL